jgi:hypothetical protein
LIIGACITTKFLKVIYFSFPSFPFFDSFMHVATTFFALQTSSSWVWNS